MRTSRPAFQYIVCAVDFSTHSAMALRYAAALARRLKARLGVVFAVDPFLSAVAAAAYDTDTLKSTARLELRRFLRKALRPAQGIPVECDIVVGKPVSAILSACVRSGAQMLVIGTHGLSGVKRAFFGSTSAGLLGRSSVPILAIPPRCRFPREQWPQAGAVGALPFGEHASQDAALMAEISASLGIPLDLVVTVPKVRVPLWVRVSKRAIDQRHAAAAQSWLDRRLAAGSAGSATDTHVLVGDKAEDVAAFAAARGTDLLLVEAAARGPARLGAGDITYRLLCTARCPVLVLPVPRKSARTAARRRFRSVA
jgi:nucleotide-binding universal stress UspA family protein